MRRFLYILVISFCGLLAADNAFCCTSAIFSGKVTSDGRPIIWKNRDSDSIHNRVEKVEAGDGIKYSFLYLSNSKDEPKEAWSGVNSAGFSIMNTVSYNIRQEGDDTPESQMDREGAVMYMALASCTTLEDFERMLDSLEKPMGLETSFGVIDSQGGAAYYEVNNYEWVKYDVNDAPEGYIIRSNYSFSGRPNEGKGYVRYENASQLVKARLGSGRKIDVRFVIDGLSRSYYQSEFGENPLEDGKSFFVDRDFIPRKSSVAATIVQGAGPGEDSSGCVFWCALGYPPTSVIAPIRLGEDIPDDYRAGAKDGHAAACDRSLQLKKEVFSLNLGDGRRYVYFDRLRPIMKSIREQEDKIFGDEAAQVR